MFIEKNKSITNGQRWINIYNFFFKKKFIIKLKKIKNKSGRGISGRILLFHRKTPTNSMFLNLKNNFYYSTYLLTINFNNFYKMRLPIMEVIDSRGNNYYFRYISGVDYLDIITILPLKMNFDVYNYFGSIVIIYILPINYPFCNILLISGERIAVSRGSYCKVTYFDKFTNLVTIKLPSSAEKIISSSLLCTIGRIGCERSYTEIYGKAGISYFIGKKSIVRGVAMNPVDHPHGGRTKSNSPEVSPWGWVTKYNR